MTRDELIEHYNQKIEICDKQIKSATEAIRKIRHEGPDSCLYSREELSNDRKIANAQRQCYVQFISDIENELDMTECSLYVDPEKSCQALKDRKK